jgi:phenylalanyl-tRNA synthetase beta chain
VLHNPMSAEQSRMRRTLLGSLLDVAAHNRSHGAGALRLFEIGAVFLPVPGEPLPREPQHVGGLLYGPVRPPSWRDPEPRTADYFAVRGVVEALLGGLGAELGLERAGEAFLHPGRAATIALGGRAIGWVGEVHPLVAAQWDLDDVVAAFELDLDAVPIPPTPTYRDLMTFPAVREDLAVVVPEAVTAARVLEVARRAGQPLLAEADVFDVFRDAERLGERNVSLALRLSYRAADRTLTDEEVAGQREAIVAALAAELEGRVRAG